MVRRIEKAAVIGSGIMGGGIAALFAAAGIPTLLLDIVPFDLKDEEKNDPAARNRIVKQGLENNPDQKIEIDLPYVTNLMDMTNRFVHALESARAIIDKYKHMDPTNNAAEVYERTMKMMEAKYGGPEVAVSSHSVSNSPW